VSGGSPYGSHAPMFKTAYVDVTSLDGAALVKQTINWGVDLVTFIPTTTTTPTTTTPTTTTPTTTEPISDLLLYAAIGIGAVVVILVIVVVVRKR
ncbi:MAG: hypothetical protein ACTSVR_08310, partial [Candidatus Thorarchaeota archaeon]